MTAEIHAIPFGGYPVANCPQCRGVHWLLFVDRPGNEFGTLIGVECHDCGLEILFTATQADEV